MQKPPDGCQVAGLVCLDLKRDLNMATHTLSSAEAEFVAASQADQEAIYLRALLRGFNFRQVGATEIWEDNASCIMMSENPANRERTRHVDTRVHYLRELVRDGHVKLLNAQVCCVSI